MFTEIVQTAPPAVFAGIMALPLAIAGVGTFVSLRSARLARIIARTPTSAIASAAAGYIEVEGEVEALGGLLLTAPLTDVEVCWYRSKVERFVPSSRTDTSQATWATEAEEVSSAPFMVRDASGACAVFPDGAEVTPTDRSVWYGATPEPEDRNPERVGPGESAEGMVRIGGTAGRRYRYTEERIYAGDPLYALGELTVGEEGIEVDDDEEDRGDDEASAVERTAAAVSPRRLAKPRSGGQPFVLSTTPQDELRAAHHAGSRFALAIVALGLALASLLLWTRFVS